MRITSGYSIYIPETEMYWTGTGKRYQAMPVTFSKETAIKKLKQFTKNTILAGKHTEAVLRHIEIEIHHTDLDTNLSEVKYIADIERTYGSVISSIIEGSGDPLKWRYVIRRKGKSYDVIKNIGYNRGSITLFSSKEDYVQAIMSLCSSEIARQYDLTDILERYT